MNHNVIRRLSVIGTAAILAAVCAQAQNHQWAGRQLDQFEWTIHERLSALPFHGVFDTLRFETNGSSVTLSGQVVKPGVKEYAERAVRRLAGVQQVVNRIEVLPPSRTDDALRRNIYVALYHAQPPEGGVTAEEPHIHIIVKNGWVWLEGFVGSDSERSSAHHRALQVTACVTDNLRVSAASL
jgi:hyperosmotically inducible periplasmic protein